MVKGKLMGTSDIELELLIKSFKGKIGCFRDPRIFRILHKFIVFLVAFSILMNNIASASMMEEIPNITASNASIRSDLIPDQTFEDQEFHLTSSLLFHGSQKVTIENKDRQKSSDILEHSTSEELEAVDMLTSASSQQRSHSNIIELVDNAHIENKFKTEDQLIIHADGKRITFPSITVEAELTPKFLKQNIILFIEKYLIEEGDIPESEWKKNVRLILKIIIPTLIGLAEGVTTIEPSCRAAQGILPLCITYSTGTFLALGGAAAWATLELMNLFDPHSVEEDRILFSSTKYEIPKRIVSLGLASIATLIPVFLVYKYNTNKWLAIPAFFTNFIFKSVGFYKLIAFLSSSIKGQTICNGQREIEQQVHKIYEQLIEEVLLDNVDSSTESIKSRIKAKVEEFLESNRDIYVIETDMNNPRVWKNGYPRTMIQVSSLIFPFGDAIFSGALAYLALNSVFSSQLLCFSGAVVSMLPGLALNTWATTSKVGDIFDASFYKIKNKKTKTFYSTNYPILSKVTVVFAIVISACYAISNAYIAGDTLNQFSSLGILMYILPVMVFGSHIFFGSFTNTNLTQKVIEKNTATCGTEQQRSNFFVLQKLEILKEFLKSYLSIARSNQGIEDPIQY